MSPPEFESICEIEPPTRPDLMHVRHQIGVLSKVASAYLIPDNHVGRGNRLECRRGPRGRPHGRTIDRLSECPGPQCSWL